MSEPVTIQVKQDDLKKVFKIIDSGRSPRVKFCDDMEAMRAEADKITKDALFDISVTLAAYINNEIMGP